MRKTNLTQPISILLACGILTACAGMRAQSVPKSALLFPAPSVKAPLPRANAAIASSRGYFVYSGLTQQRNKQRGK